MSTEIQRNSKGQFPAGKSGNPTGRKPGSRNKVTLLKLMAEEAVRDNHYEDMLEVCNLVIDAAKGGDSTCRKLVWDTVMSKGISDQRDAVDKVSITINEVSAPKGVTIEGEVQDGKSIREDSRKCIDADDFEGDTVPVGEQGETGELRPRSEGDAQ